MLNKVLDFIEQRQTLYFRALIVLLIIIMLLVAERLQSLVLFVSVGLVLGAIYYRVRGRIVEIGAFIGACVGILFSGVYYLCAGIQSFQSWFFSL